MPTHPVVGLRRVICAIKNLLESRHHSDRFVSGLQSFEDQVAACARPSTVRLHSAALRHWSAWASRQSPEMDLLSPTAVASWTSTLDGLTPVVFKRYQSTFVRLLISVTAPASVVAQLLGARPGSSAAGLGMPSPAGHGGRPVRAHSPECYRRDRVRRFLDCTRDEEAANRFAELLDDWVGMKPSSRRTYERASDAWIKWASTEDVQGRKLMSARALESYVTSLGTRRASPSTVSVYLTVLRFIGAKLQWLDGDGQQLIESAARAARRRLEDAVRDGPFLDWEAIRTMLEVVNLSDPHQVRDAALVLVIYETMVSPQDIVVTAYNDPAASIFRAENVKVRTDGSSRIGRFWLSPLATQWLTRWSRLMGDRGPLFPCKHTTVASRLCEWAWRAGLRMDRLDLSAIRASAVRALARAGANPRALQEIAGRKSSRFALRYLGGDTAPVAAAKLSIVQGRTELNDRLRPNWFGVTPRARSGRMARGPSPQLALFG